MGEWLCTAFSNVAYGVMLNDSCGAFFPSLLNHGWETVIFGSALIWIMYFIVAQGIKTAKFINTLLASVKVVMLLFIIIVFVVFLIPDCLKAMFGDLIPNWIPGDTGKKHNDGDFILLLWCRGCGNDVSKSKTQFRCGQSRIAGFIISLVLYMSVSLLCFGLLSSAKLAGLQDPSIAYILRSTVGEWAYWFVICAVIISLIGGWVAWTLVVAQVPYEASLVGILPSSFQQLNRHGMPAYGLFASSVVMELFLLLVVMADNVYMAALRITGLMIIPCYFFTGLFLLKKARTTGIRILAIVTSAFCLWMAYAGGLTDMLMTSVFYILGTVFFIRARIENNPNGRIFTFNEKCGLYLLIICSLLTIGIIARNSISNIYFS